VPGSLGVNSVTAALGSASATSGPPVWIQVKLSGLPSGSVDPEPSSVTAAPGATSASGPALASGSRLMPPLITSANGWAELGTLNARTVIV